MSQNEWMVLEIESKRVELAEDIWIEIKTQVTAGDYEDFQNSQNAGKGTSSYSPASLLFLMLTGWSFLDKEDKPLPLAYENIRKIPAKKATFMLMKIAETLGDDNPLEESPEAVTP